ncbi:MAG: hypothetical protein HUJ25_12615 [Crocinitomicaceae bacterium]|nr:hypothetical protein [Crocinitomicaceae bacterium]
MTKKLVLNTFKQEGFDVSETETANGVEELRVKTQDGKVHRILLQELDLHANRNIKILKTDLGELNDNRWIALVLRLPDMEPTIYLIPSTVFSEPDDFVFIENNQNPRLAHFSNYEIKVFRNGMSKLNEYRIENMLGKL